MADRVEVLAGIVFRLGRNDLTDRYLPNGWVPDVDDFSLSSTEREETQRLGGIGSLSVWDDQLIAPEGANTFLPMPTKTRIVLDLEVTEIRALVHKLHVYRQPADKPLPGREAHCVVENAWSEEKRIRREIQSDLVNISRVRGCVRGTVFTPF
jgi:hypothetical protein